MVRESGTRIARASAGLVAVLLLLISANAFSQVHVELSSRSLAVGERLTIDIQIDYEDPDDVVVPEVSFRGFRLVEGPSVRPVNRLSVDQRTRVVEIQFGFVAEEAGRYVLDPVPIQVAGQEFRTPPKLVEVGMRGNRDQVPFLARWVLPEGPLMVGEARPVLLEIYNADDFVYPSEISVRQPDQAIFEEVQGLGTIRQTSVDGVTLYQIPVAVFMVTPSAAGSVDIAAAEVGWEGLAATAPAARIAVEEIPGGIAATGAIGRFSLSATLDRSTLSATESAELVVRLEGVGNLHFLQLPEVVADGFVLEAEVRSERLAPTDQGYSGFLESTYTLRPSGTGSGRISVGQFAHFDPLLRRIVQTRLPEFPMEVTPVKEPVTDDGPVVSLELLSAQQIAAAEPRNLYRSALSYGVFAPGFLFFLAFRIWRRRGAQASVIALVGFLFVSAASDYLPWSDINRALELYEAGDRISATHAFETASRRAPESPGIQHNLAVLYYQRGDIGRSVYAIREAVRLNPSSADIRATQLLIERAAELDRSVPARHLVHPDLTFIVLAGVVNVLFVLLAFVGRTKGLRRAGLLAIGQILLAVITIALVVGLAVTARAHEEQVGVVLKELSLLRIPSHTAESWLDLRAGTAVDLVSQKDGFVLVRTDLGLEGWVPINSVLWPRNPAISVLRYRAFAL